MKIFVFGVCGLPMGSSGVYDSARKSSLDDRPPNVRVSVSVRSNETSANTAVSSVTVRCDYEYAKAKFRSKSQK